MLPALYNPAPRTQLTHHVSTAAFSTSPSATSTCSIIVFTSAISQTTISSMRAVLKAIYQYAKLNEYIDRDLTEGLVYEWTNSTEQIHDRYSDEEIKTLWSKLYEINNVDIILIMIYTGLRPTELLVIITPTEPT